MKSLGRFVGLMVLAAFIGCGNTDLNKDLKPVPPTAKPFTPGEGVPGKPAANPGADPGSQTQKVITK